MRPASVYADVDGLRVHSYTSGPDHGLPVILIHGWASSGRMWATTMDEALGDFRCFALDLPGHGRSHKPPQEWYSIPGFGRVLAGFCESVGAASPSIIGHSMGGTIALEAVMSQELTVRSLVLVNPLISGRAGLLQWWPRPNNGGPLWRIARRIWPVATRAVENLSTHVSGWLPEHVVRNQIDLASTTADSALGSLRAVAMSDLRARLSAVRVPTLVMVGDQDRVVPPVEGIQAASLLPEATLVRLACGHQPHDEAPQAFQETLKEFLRSLA